MTHLIKPLSMQCLTLIRDEDTFASWSKHDIERFISLPTTKSWMVTSNELLAGLLLVAHVEGEIDILTIATLEAFRREGVANALLQHLISYARAAEVKTVFLDIKENNNPARALYEKWGFLPYGKRENYYQELNESVIGAILYRLDLNDLEKKNKIKLD